METLLTTLKPELPVGSDLANALPKGAEAVAQKRNELEVLSLIEFK